MKRGHHAIRLLLLLSSSSPSSSLTLGRVRALRALGERSIQFARDGHYDRAEALQRRVLNGMQKHGHPDIATALNNLADTCYLQGALEEAERLQRELWSFQRERLGDGHPQTLKVMGILLPVTLTAQGRFAEAMGLCSEAGSQMDEHLGEMHPHTIAAAALREVLAAHVQGTFEAAPRHP
mmetsp:Transcript_28793/g.92577  ORF Transcript_28793/g.92577 Transcript_28793/m.92577 type:complete len:180 (-) Transcript_28793:401-940(-)